MSDNYNNETYFADNNTSLTQIDNKKMSTLTKMQDETTNNSSSLQTGTIIDNYIIFDKLSKTGNESEVYLAKKDGNQFAFKLYKRKLQYDNSKMSLLKEITCPYIVKLYDIGEYNGFPYEVYEYYENGTLQEYGKVDEKNIKEFIYQLNEGLNALHNLSDSNAIIHGDIKPSNIFISNDRTKLLIGDFGISSFLENSEQTFGNICGTPEYAPPSIGVVDKVKKTKAYDYGSLGLVVYFMVTGYSLFANRTTEEIAEAWANGIVIPEHIDTRTKILLKGLLNSNEESRFGYKKVKDWYEGSFVRLSKPKDLFNKKRAENNTIPLWFGIFNDEVVEVSSISELVKQMKIHWEQAIFKLRDTNLFQFLEQFDETSELSAEIKTIVDENDNDSAVFKTIYLLSSDSDIVYKGINYGNPVQFIETISKDDDENAKEIMVKGLFEYYITQMGYGNELLNTIKTVMNNQYFTNEIKFRILRYIFTKNKQFENMSSIDDLRERISNMTLEQIDSTIKNDDFIAWLFSIGLQDLATNLVINKGETNE